MGNTTSKALEELKRRKDLEYEARKREIELCSQESKNNYELQIRKADMEHQHKIAELITQMKQTKLQAGKELLLSYMDTMNIIIQQNGNCFNAAIPLLQQLNNDKLSDSLRGATEKAIQKIYDSYKTTEELLDYSKKQIKELQLKQDDEFARLLDFAVEQKVITEKNKIYLLEGEHIFIGYFSISTIIS
ncbi:3392_t:CDS:2 [Funneliformis caledonium]|uniref:3392_t:CDS:1 n=1 Tax=Funneliformis caledonium TaxID=1117310 RepID=A0A9N9HDB8_9GLOM|nr:3392_t:CDS:2 [Funneliformis caledonium]